MAYTLEQKKQYFSDLRKEWQVSKKLADNDKVAQALFRETGGNFGYYGFYFTYMSMQAQGLDGVPHVDAKTYQKWLDSGFQVKKGEISTLDGITWIASKRKDKNGEEKDARGLYPKRYRLFHRTQVEAI